MVHAKIFRCKQKEVGKGRNLMGSDAVSCLDLCTKENIDYNISCNIIAGLRMNECHVLAALKEGVSASFIYN